MKAAGEVKILYDFTHSDACPWFAIDDVVMGSVSRSTMCMENSRAVFAGVVSQSRSPVHSPDRKIESGGEAHPEPIGQQ